MVKLSPDGKCDDFTGAGVGMRAMDPHTSWPRCLKD
jgi:hypothetical protein